MHDKFSKSHFNKKLLGMLGKVLSYNGFVKFLKIKDYLGEDLLSAMKIIHNLIR